MSEFHKFKTAVAERFKYLYTKYELFCVETEDKNELWNTYLNSFAEGTNPLYKERTEYDCNCCKQFIRTVGNVVAIVDNKIESLWAIQPGAPYQVVTDALNKLILSKPIKNRFTHFERKAGTDYNHQMLPSGEAIKWEHFFVKIPSAYVKTDPGKFLSDTQANKDVFARGLEELSLETLDTAIELVEQGSVYRGQEQLKTVKQFRALQVQFQKVPTELQDNFCWANANKPSARIRNTAFGTFLVDIAEGMELDKAVYKFGEKMAPGSYKRPTSVVTKAMITNAQKKVVELGIAESLPRRHAQIDDITINNVLFADRSAKKAMNVFDELIEAVPTNTKSLDAVESVSIETFIADILPKAESVEVLVENKHKGNFVTLIAPENSAAPNILKWGNNFSWSYTGEVTDSMKERVKAAGGKIDGVMRFSIQWNENQEDQNIDLDAHCVEPTGNLIFYGRKCSDYSCGQLDVDIRRPGPKVAVENITWARKNKILQGQHQFIVHNYSSRTSKAGFTAEIECDGVIHSYSYEKPLKGRQKVTVATVEVSQDSFKITDKLPSGASSKEIWGINTGTFNKISVIMNSPNHWDGEETGNKHYMFMLEGCANPDNTRGLYNEFLQNNLTEHRKVFEVLGSKLKVPTSDNQLSGIGFSSTQHNELFCKVTGSFSRTIKIVF